MSCFQSTWSPGSHTHNRWTRPWVVARWRGCSVPSMICHIAGRANTESHASHIVGKPQSEVRECKPACLVLFGSSGEGLPHRCRGRRRRSTDDFRELTEGTNTSHGSGPFPPIYLEESCQETIQFQDVFVRV